MPSLDPNLKTAQELRELAEHHWRLAGNAPDPDPDRMYAMRLHTRAIMLEAMKKQF